MTLDRDDIRAAVRAGMISEAQAASVLALADERRGLRETLEGLAEPFELFRGFNEIFIVVGLTILFMGWIGLTGFGFVALGGPAGSRGMILAAIGAGGLLVLSRYFTSRRRMIAPSIALVVMFTLMALQFGFAAGWHLGFSFQYRLALSAGLTTLALMGHYALFRVPFSMALIALGSFATVASFFIVGGAVLPQPRDLFLLSNTGPFAGLTIVMGLICLSVALAFDMSDPHRVVTRRSTSGFWLHVVAAPAIVNTVALSLLETRAGSANVLLLIFLTSVAIFAVIIDRRSFLVSGVGYVVTLSVIVLEDRAGLAILLLGLALVFLGAQWERLRRSLMNLLPAFPGKTRLPPWDLIQAKDQKP